VISLLALLYSYLHINFLFSKGSGQARPLNDRPARTVAEIVTRNIQGGKLNDPMNLSRAEMEAISGFAVQVVNLDGNPLYSPGIDTGASIELSAEQRREIGQGGQVAAFGEGSHFNAFPLKSDQQVVGAIIVYRKPMPHPPPGQGPPPPPPNENALTMAFRIFIFGFLPPAVVALIIALISARGFTGPIRSLEKAAGRLAEGDFSQSLDLNRNDEVGNLAKAFDTMAAKLKSNAEGRKRLMEDITHELNTPLNAILVFSEAMQDGIINDPEGRKKYLNLIIKEIGQLSFLINDITELSKFEAGDVRLNPSPFRAADPINQAIESARTLAAQKEIQISSRIPDPGMGAYGDAERILQVIQNLLNNAIVHNPPQTRITVSTVQSGKEVIFSVEDNGRGIPAEDINQIFDRFYKVDKARSRNQSGSGLGLAIVKRILEAHHSGIFVESLRPGTRFFFSLPATEPTAR